MNPFQNKTRKPVAERTALGKSLDAITSMMNQNQVALSSNVAKGCVSLEGIDDTVVLEMDNASETLTTALESIYTLSLIHI